MTKTDLIGRWKLISEKRIQDKDFYFFDWMNYEWLILDDGTAIKYHWRDGREFVWRDHEVKEHRGVVSINVCGSDNGDKWFCIEYTGDRMTLQYQSKSIWQVYERRKI